MRDDMNRSSVRQRTSTGKRQISGSENRAASGRTQKRRRTSGQSQSRPSQSGGRRRTGSGKNASYRQNSPRSGSDSVRRNNKRVPGQRRRTVRRKSQKKGCFNIFLFILAIVICLVLLFLVVRSCSKSLKENINPTTVSENVLAYEPTVRQQAEQNGIGEYTNVLLSIMMQESKGKGNDPMQSSECIYNTRYDRTADGIQDPAYSIECGVRYFADALKESGCSGLTDTNALMLAIQGYNFGHGYIPWAIENYGGYSVDNAEIFSKMVQEELDWTSYGDPEYAVKVMNFYNNSFNNNNSTAGAASTAPAIIF